VQAGVVQWCGVRKVGKGVRRCVRRVLAGGRVGTTLLKSRRERMKNAAACTAAVR